MKPKNRKSRFTRKQKIGFARKMKRYPARSEADFDRLCLGELNTPVCLFQKQRVLFNFIADYFCKKHSLIVEVDGSSHIDRAWYDSMRDKFFLDHGILTMRFTHENVLSDPNSVVAKVKAALAGRLPFSRYSGKTYPTFEERKEFKRQESDFAAKKYLIGLADRAEWLPGVGDMKKWREAERIKTEPCWNREEDQP